MLALSTARLMAGVKGMYRVALSAALAVSLAACSLNTSAISTGFFDSSTTPSIGTAPIATGALGGEPTVDRPPPRAPIKTPKLHHQAPSRPVQKGAEGPP